MSNAGWIQKRERAETCIEKFIQRNPEYSVNASQPECHGCTNFITFGTFRNQPVVFKYFDCPLRKQHEEEALRMMAPTGLVPRLYAPVTDGLIIMERMRGCTVDEALKGLNQAQTHALYRHLGRAMARFVTVAPGRACSKQYAASESDWYQFYCDTDIATFFDAVMARSAKVLDEQDVPERAVLEKSHRALQESREAILAYPSFVHMDDFHNRNMMADGQEFVGFIDLEMTRFGNEAMLLAAGIVATMGKDSLWRNMRQGYEDARQRTIDAATLSIVKIAAPFSQWIRFMWYWTRDLNQLEEGARAWPVRDIKAIVQGLESMKI